MLEIIAEKREALEVVIPGNLSDGFGAYPQGHTKLGYHIVVDQSLGTLTDGMVDDFVQIACGDIHAVGIEVHGAFLTVIVDEQVEEAGVEHVFSLALDVGIASY